MGGDVRITSGGQNSSGGIIAASVEDFGKRRALIIALVNASGDIYNAGGGSSGGSTPVYGTVDDDAVSPGAPVMIGGMAAGNDNVNPGAVSASGDVARFRTDMNRRLLVSARHPNGWHANENYGSAQSNNQLQAAPGAGLALYVTDLIISNGATAGTIKIVEDTTDASGDVFGPYYFAANGGMSKSFATPRRITTNKDVGVTSVTVTTHTVTLLGYIAP